MLTLELHFLEFSNHILIQAYCK